jgi:hypothetical protein
MRPAVAAFALLVAAASTACGGGSKAETITKPTAAVVNLPSRLVGLRVVRENVTSQLQGVSASYLDSVGLFSFREKSNLLRGTLQVGRFNKVAHPDQSRFRDGVIAQLGSTIPVRVRVGHTDVWLSAGTDQSIYTWFSGEAFYVLSVRSDYPFPRTLLRKLVTENLLP